MIPTRFYLHVPKSQNSKFEQCPQRVRNQKNYATLWPDAVKWWMQPSEPTMAARKRPSDVLTTPSAHERKHSETIIKLAVTKRGLSVKRSNSPTICDLVSNAFHNENGGTYTSLPTLPMITRASLPKGPLAELVRGTQRHSSGPGFDSPWERISGWG